MAANPLLSLKGAPHKGRKIPANHHPLIYEAYSQGKRVKDIAAYYGCGTSRIYMIIKEQRDAET